MLKLHVLQAQFGDCLMLEYGTAAQPHFMLIDGGPPTTYDRHLRGVLEEVGAAGRPLDLVALSHVDNDHIIGLLDYFAELRGTANPSLPAAGGLWHNSFTRTLDTAGDIQVRMNALVTNTRAAVMTAAGAAVNGIGEGNSLRLAATALGVPLNQGFPSDLVLVDTAPSPITFQNLALRITGPTQANLDSLQAEWEAWLDKHEDEVGTDDPFVMANSDQSVPNLSSITFLAEADGKRILFTGDGRSDHLLDGLGAAGLLDSAGRMHVDLLKLAHHGSNRNTTKTFFKKVTADTYVASANGKDDNPDLATLIWIVEAAKEQNRAAHLFVTNQTPSVKKLLEEYPKGEYGYTLETLPANAHRKTINLA
jgi:hypothetical protein